MVQGRSVLGVGYRLIQMCPTNHCISAVVKGVIPDENKVHSPGQKRNKKLEQSFMRWRVVM